MTDNDPLPTEPDNVVPLVENIMAAGKTGQQNLELQRRIAFKAFEIAIKQLSRDAESIVNSAIVKEHTVPERISLMHTAGSLLVAQNWLRGLMGNAMPVEEPAPAPNAS